MDKKYTIWIYVFLHPQNLCLAKDKTTKDKDQGQDALPQLKKIEGKIKAAVLGSEEVQGGGEDIFEEPQQGDGEAENKGKSKKILKDVLQKGPPLFKLTLETKEFLWKHPRLGKKAISWCLWTQKAWLQFVISFVKIQVVKKKGVQQD